jgi:transmembrane sensor
MNRRNIKREAAQWFLDLRDVQFSLTQWEAFETWLCANPAHVEAYEEAEETWNKAVQVRRRQLRDSQRPHHPEQDRTASADSKDQTRSAQPRRRIRFRWAAAAACAVLTVLAAIWIMAPGQWITYRTAVGERMQISLRDGSTVEMNTNTSLRVRVTSAARQIAVLQGEALFHVAHDARRPFEVIVPMAVVRDIGTVFNVRLENRQTIVLVAEGRVSFQPSHNRETGPPALPAGWVLSPGELLTIALDAAGEAIPLRRVLTPEEVARKLAWTKGELRFYDTTLAEVVAEFNRYGSAKIVIADPEVALFRMGGAFRTDAPESFIEATERLYSVEARYVDRGGSTLIVLSRSHHGRNRPADK